MSGRKKHLDDYEAWTQLSGPGSEGVKEFLADPTVDFKQVSPTSYSCNEEVYEFGPFLASSERPSFPFRIDRDHAALYFIYRRTCARVGVEPQDYVDTRRVVTAQGVVYAQDILGG